MSALERISKKDLKELLNQGWMTHDAMWFVSCYQRFGIETTNELNLSAIALMSSIEVGRIRRAIGMDKVEIDTFEKMCRFVKEAMDLVLPEFMQAEFAFTAKNRMRWKWKEGQCFAYKGLKRIGALENYRCGVMYRIECWLRAMDIRYTIDPPVEGCLMHTRGSCEGEFRFFFPE